MTESRPQEGSPGAPASGEASTPQKSDVSLVSTYRNTAARLLAVHADRVPLDITPLVSVPVKGRVRMGVVAQPAGARRAHIAETSEQYGRPADVLGLAVLNFVTIRTVTFHEGVVGGDEHTMRQEYDDGGSILPGETSQTERVLSPEEATVLLGEITERVIDMTVDVPDATITTIEQALIASEAQRQASPHTPSV